MSEAASERDPLEVLAADFIERRRRGESPSISDYADQHPELADEIRDLFPTIAAMERLKARKEASSGLRGAWGTPKLERLGDFRILGEIGRGGMGIVFEAFQESLGRHVAVKVLPRQALLEPRQLQRFQRESQTAARLHHTNIVPVFGIGEQDGFHYLVMQLIRGVGLDQILGQLRPAGLPGATPAAEQAATPARSASASEVVRLAGLLVQGQFWQARESRPSSFDASESAAAAENPHVAAAAAPPSGGSVATEDFLAERTAKVSQGLGARVGDASLPSCGHSWRFGPAYWRSVAAIGLQVAEALHYAHAQHTLHRDIKPANLLLDSQGVVWITDFGLAKAMEQDHLTQTGGIVGTLRYMAPEQFSGRIDAQSDVYSLGLTLYELVTLRPAFDDHDRSSLIHKITHQQPIRPRKLNPAIPRDLETIVLKASAYDAAHRYRTAGELARDLRRFLEDRPIQARRTSPLERLWRWSRRNRVIAALAASTLVLLIVVALVASVGYVQTKRASDEEARQRKKAEDTSKLALEALDNIFQQFAPDRTASASAAALTVVGAEGEEVAVPVQPVLSKEAAALLEQMLAFYDRFAAQGGDDARLRRKVAQANRRVGDIRQRLGQYEQSKTAYLRAVELYHRLLEAAGNDVTLRSEIARVQNELGNVYGAMNQAEASRASHVGALDTLKSIAGEAAASPQYQFELARTYYFLSKRPGRDLGPPPPGPGDRRGPPGKPEEGGPAGPPPGFGQRDGQGIRPPLRPGVGLLGPGLYGLLPEGPARLAVIFFKERKENLHKAIELLERLVNEHSNVPDYRHLLACCYREELMPWFMPAPDQAASSAHKATAILQRLVEQYPSVPDYRYDLSETYAMLDGPRRFPFAATDPPSQRPPEMLEKALAISEELVSEHPNVPDYAASQVHIRLRLAGFFHASDAAQAEAHLRKALELQATLVRRFPGTSFYKFSLAMVQDSLAGLLEEGEKLADARSLLEQSIASFQAASQEDLRAPVRGPLAHGYRNLARLLHRMGEEEAAAAAAQQAKEFEPGPY